MLQRVPRFVSSTIFELRKRKIEKNANNETNNRVGRPVPPLPVPFCKLTEIAERSDAELRRNTPVSEKIMRTILSE